MIFFALNFLEFLLAWQQFVFYLLKVFWTELDEIFKIIKFFFVITFDYLLNSINNILLEVKADFLHAEVVNLRILISLHPRILNSRESIELVRIYISLHILPVFIVGSNHLLICDILLKPILALLLTFLLIFFGGWAFDDLFNASIFLLIIVFLVIHFLKIGKGDIFEIFLQIFDIHHLFWVIRGKNFLVLGYISWTV